MWWMTDSDTAFRKNSRIRSLILACIALIAIAFAVYLQAGEHQFLDYDDGVYVTENSHVSSGITGENILWAFTSVDAGNWHPVTWISHMADVQFYGMNPRGHHLTNVGIHALSAAILFLCLFRLTGARWQSLFVAALFALHPLHVESVAWVAERKDVLSGFFGFLALLIYSEYAKNRGTSLAKVFTPHPHPNPPPEGEGIIRSLDPLLEGVILTTSLPFQGGGQEGDGVECRDPMKRILYLLTLVSFTLGLMSKPMLVTLPLVMLMIDYWPLGRYQCKEQGKGSHAFFVCVKEKIPFFACSLCSGIVTIYAQHSGGAMSDLDVVSLWLRIENSLIAYVSYIGKTFWPHDLAVFYPLSFYNPLWQTISSLLVLFFVSAAVVRVRHQYPYLAVGWFWFLITLVPVIGFIQVGGQSMADRYSYIPVTGLFIMTAWGCADLTKGLRHREGILALLAGTIIAASAALTWQQLGYWRDSISLYRHTVQATEGNYWIHYNLGVALADKGDLDAAIREYRETLRIKPDYAKAHNNLGFTLATKGNLDAAIREFREALRINPRDINFHNNLGLVLARKGDLDAAIQEFQEALRINPAYTEAEKNLGVALAQKRMQREQQ